jgi:hypothetical protein
MPAGKTFFGDPSLAANGARRGNRSHHPFRGRLQNGIARNGGEILRFGPSLLVGDPIRHFVALLVRTVDLVFLTVGCFSASEPLGDLGFELRRTAAGWRVDENLVSRRPPLNNKNGPPRTKPSGAVSLGGPNPEERCLYEFPPSQAFF